MKLAEFCNTSPSYIGEIEIGRKFPSMEMVEKIAEVLRIKPYYLFRNHTETSDDSDSADVYPLLPNAMKTEIKDLINSSITKIIDKY